MGRGTVFDTGGAPPPTYREGDGSVMNEACEIDVLDAGGIAAANSMFGLHEGRLRELLAMAGAFGLSPEARQLAERFHRLFYHSCFDAEDAAAIWKTEGSVLGGTQAGMAALLILSGASHLEALYREKGLPRQVLPDSLKDLSIWMDDHFESTGGTGVTEVGWLLRTMRGNIFRLGRLQFVQEPLRENVVVLKRKCDGAAVLFFHEPVQLREDGQVDGTNSVFSEHTFQSSFTEDETCFSGTPVHPDGYVLNKRVRLDKREWEAFVRPGAGSLGVHIPKDGKMEIDMCRESFEAAVRFFPRYFPGRPIGVFTVDTWFLDAQLRQILPPESNIVRFQKEFYAYPVLADEKFTYSRVFGNPVVDIASVPEDTALRRSIKRFVLSGGKMRFSAGVLLADDLPLFGSAHYEACSAGLVESLG